MQPMHSTGKRFRTKAANACPVLPNSEIIFTNDVNNTWNKISRMAAVGENVDTRNQSNINATLIDTHITQLPWQHLVNYGQILNGGTSNFGVRSTSVLAAVAFFLMH